MISGALHPDTSPCTHNRMCADSTYLYDLWSSASWCFSMHAQQNVCRQYLPVWSLELCILVFLYARAAEGVQTDECFRLSVGLVADLTHQKLVVNLLHQLVSVRDHSVSNRHRLLRYVRILNPFWHNFSIFWNCPFCGIVLMVVGFIPPLWRRFEFLNLQCLLWSAGPGCFQPHSEIRK